MDVSLHHAELCVRHTRGAQSAGCWMCGPGAVAEDQTHDHLLREGVELRCG